MLLFAGLGNPGKTMLTTGTMPVSWRSTCLPTGTAFLRGKPETARKSPKGGSGRHKILAIKPQSFMNKSGLPVAEAARFYKIPPETCFVFYDEIDLPAGKIRVKCGGGHGGHNGIRDIDRHIGTDYWRVRIGVGRPEQVFPGSRSTSANGC